MTNLIDDTQQSFEGSGISEYPCGWHDPVLNALKTLHDQFIEGWTGRALGEAMDLIKFA